jgi:hypothetical protein
LLIPLRDKDSRGQLKHRTLYGFHVIDSNERQHPL